jgi:hypothetical protein
VRADVLGPHALGLGDAACVLSGLRAMAGHMRRAQVAVAVVAADLQRDDVLDLPRLAREDAQVADVADASGSVENAGAPERRHPTAGHAVTTGPNSAS